MQFFTTSVAATLLACILSLTSAAPATSEKRQQAPTTITFTGAASASYTLTPPFQGQNITITNPLSVSHISVNNAEGLCTYRGIDGGSFFTVGSFAIDVGPPQALTSVKCCDFSEIGFPQYCERR
ncbi:MAG: hypothetical protein Q9202_002949 [Teloschistes flavicans]